MIILSMDSSKVQMQYLANILHHGNLEATNISVVSVIRLWDHCTPSLIPILSGTTSCRLFTERSLREFLESM